MQPETLRELQALQRRAAQLSGLARGLSQAAPERAEGRDATGWVTAVLDRAGRPMAIEIRDGWNERLDVDRLGAAVAEACAAAVREGMRSWSAALDDSRWYRQRSAFIRGDDLEDEAETPDLPVGQTGEVTELAEEVLLRLRSVAEENPTPEQPVATGTDDEARITVRLEPGGGVSCVIDARWAAPQNGQTITRVLTIALERARKAQQNHSTAMPSVDGLLGDVLATLASFNTQQR